MSHPALSRHPLTSKAVQLAPKAGFLLALSVVVLGGAFYVPNAKYGLFLLFVGMTLLATTAIIQHLTYRKKRAQIDLHKTISEFVALDASASFTTNREGVIGYRNKAALDRFGSGNTETLLGTLGDLFAAPGATLYRLQTKALAKGAAREDVVMRRGHLRLSVHQIGDDGFLWRLEDIAERTNPGRGGDGISLPMMTVSKAGTVLFMNDALRRLLGGREANIDRIFNDLPLRPDRIHEVAGPKVR